MLDEANAFDQFYREMWSLDPFEWQRELVEQVRTESRWPDLIDLPTGAGKTSTIDIALFLLALDAANAPADRVMPRRIVMVVDRRVIVDQAADRAQRLLNKLKEADPGSVSHAVAGRIRQVWSGAESQPPVSDQRSPRWDRARRAVGPPPGCSRGHRLHRRPGWLTAALPGLRTLSSDGSPACWPPGVGHASLARRGPSLATLRRDTPAVGWPSPRVCPALPVVGGRTVSHTGKLGSAPIPRATARPRDQPCAPATIARVEASQPSVQPGP